MRQNDQKSVTYHCKLDEIMVLVLTGTLNGNISFVDPFNPDRLILRFRNSLIINTSLNMPH